MEIKIITIFCICYDYLKDINFKEDSQCNMITTLDHKPIEFTFAPGSFHNSTISKETSI